MKSKQQLRKPVLKETPIVGSQLAKLFHQDQIEFACCLHDANLLGVYITGSDGDFLFQQTTHVAPVYVHCLTPQDLDLLIFRFLTAAAKHARRYIIATDKNVRSYLEGAKYVLGGTGMSGNIAVVAAIPMNMAILCNEDPEFLDGFVTTMTGSVYLCSVPTIWSLWKWCLKSAFAGPQKFSDNDRKS